MKPMKSCLDCGVPSRGKRCVKHRNIHEAQSRKSKPSPDKVERFHGFILPYYLADRITPSSVREVVIDRGHKVAKRYA